MNISHYNYNKFYKDCLDIAVKLNKSSYFPDYWFALDRGGVIPAATIRRLLQELRPDLKDICGDRLFVLPKDHTPRYVEKFYYDGCNVLIIDDICDSGAQFSNIVTQQFDGASSIKFCSLIYNKTNVNNVVVDYYGTEIDKVNNPNDNDWIQFWWEFQSL